MSRVGLLGGTFDPIHNGHLDVAEAARRALGLDRVLVMPANVPPHRSAPNASAAHRFAMCALAVQDRAGLAVSDLEMRSNEPSYTAATIERFLPQAPSPKPQADLVVLTGADAFRDIRTWKNFPALLDRCHFAVVSRPGTPAGKVRELLPELAERFVDATGSVNLTAAPRVFLIDAPTAAVSSTEVRRRLAAGQSIAGLVPPAVAGHIERHELYGSTPR